MKWRGEECGSESIDDDGEDDEDPEDDEEEVESDGVESRDLISGYQQNQLYPSTSHPTQPLPSPPSSIIFPPNFAHNQHSGFYDLQHQIWQQSQNHPPDQITFQRGGIFGRLQTTDELHEISGVHFSQSNENMLS